MIRCSPLKQLHEHLESGGEMPRYAASILLLLAGFSGCSKENPPTSSKTPETPAQPAPSAAAPASAPPAAAAAPAGTLKNGDTNISGVVAEVTECARKDGVLSIKVRLRN